MPKFIAILTQTHGEGKTRTEETLKEFIFTAKTQKAAEEKWTVLLPTATWNESEEEGTLKVTIKPLSKHLQELEGNGKDLLKNYRRAVHKKIGEGTYSTDWPLALSRILGGRPSSWESFDGPDSGVGVDYFYRNKQGKEVYINLDQTHVTISDEEETHFSGEVHELNGW